MMKISMRTLFMFLAIIMSFVAAKTVSAQRVLITALIP